MAGTPVSLSGVRDTLEILQARRIVDMAPGIIMLEDNRKALMTFLDTLGVRKVTNFKFDWLTKEKVPKTHRAGAIITAVAGIQYATDTIDLSGLTAQVYVRPNDILKVQATGEIMKVLARATTAAAVLVSRNLENIALVDTAADALVTKIGNSVQENSVLRLPDVVVAGGPVADQTIPQADPLNSITTQAVDEWNYTQTFRNPVGLSRREQQAALYGGPDRPQERSEAFMVHLEECEHAFWHGIRGVATDPAGGPGDFIGTDTLTGGMIDAIPAANTFDIAGILTEEIFNDFLRTYSRYGDRKSKVLFASRFVCDVISGFTRVADAVAQPEGTNTRRQVKSGKGQTLGTEVTQYVAGVGFTAKIVPADALEGQPGDNPTAFTGSVPSEWDGFAVLVDTKDIKCAKYGDTYMKLQVDLQLPDQDGVVDAYISDIGLQTGLGLHHGLMTGITG